MLELIDGQQRFTTICLLFCALYSKLSAEQDSDDDLRLELANLKNRLFLKGAGEWRFIPSEQAQNRVDYQKVLSDIFPKLVNAPKNLTYFGNRRIAKTYAYFRTRLDVLDLSGRLMLLEKLKSAVLVKIEVPSHADAFVLFETINNRGIPLSAIDIIKNNLLAQLDRIPGYGIDRAFEEWRDLIDLIPDAAVQERFLRQLYNAFRYLKRTQVRGCPRATRSNLIRIYDTLLQRRPVWLFDALQLHGEVYANLLDHERASVRWDEQAADALRDLGHVGAAPSYAFLLWARQVAADQGWGEGATVERLARYLVKWFFWRNLTDIPATRDLDPLFMKLIEAMLGKIRAHKVQDPEGFALAVSDELRRDTAPPKLRRDRLSGDLYQDNYEVTRFMLCKLEESHQTRESRRDLWAYASNGKPVFTVEHVLPKTEQLSQPWVDMLGGDPQHAAAIQGRCAHRLGNLTLSGYNSALGRMAFLKKRDRMNERGDFIGYKNRLYLNQELVSRQDWTEQGIKARTDLLIAEVNALFGLE